MVKQSPYDRFEQRAKTIGQAAVMTLFVLAALAFVIVLTLMGGSAYGFWGYFSVPIFLLVGISGYLFLWLLMGLFQLVAHPIRKAWWAKKRAWYEKNRV